MGPDNRSSIHWRLPASRSKLNVWVLSAHSFLNACGQDAGLAEWRLEKSKFSGLEKVILKKGSHQSGPGYIP
eukprot:4416280-Pleurochrysis_carterae.AAC.3